MNINEKSRKYLLHFLAYFLLIALLPFDHCHAAIDRTETGAHHRACNATNNEVAGHNASLRAYERECHAHHLHHVRFLIDGEAVVLKSALVGVDLPILISCAIKAIIEPLFLSDLAIRNVAPHPPEKPLKFYFFKLSGLSPPSI